MEISTVSEVDTWYHGDERHDPCCSDGGESPSRGVKVDTLHRLTNGHITLVCKERYRELGHDVRQKYHANGDTTSIRTVDAETDINIVTGLPA